MRARGRARVAARLLCAAAAGALCTAAAAQPAGSAQVEPSAPLDPLPGLGVDWPDMDADPAQGPLADTPEAERAPVADPAAERRYAIAIEGMEDVGPADQLKEAFETRSALQEGDDDPANAAQIERRAAADAELLAELLRSQGYYDAIVEPQIQPADEALLVIMEVQPGAQYHFETIELPGLDATGEEAAGLREAFAVETGDAVIAEEVIAAGVALRIELGERGFALADLGEQQIVIDHDTHTASLVLPVEPGPLASFGEIRVSGRPPFGVDHIATIARFEPGDTFQRSKVDDLRRALVATGLVAGVEVEVVPGATGQTVDLAVHLQPAPMRTVAGELGYGTGEGARAEASWQHRNFINPEGALTLRGVAGTREQLAAVQFRRNNFRGRDQVVDLQAVASNLDRDAYRARTVMIAGRFERLSNIIWPKTWTWSLGAELIATDERGIFRDLANKETRAFLIAALPVSLRYDGSDDLLNPTEGFRLGARVSPEISAKGGGGRYARAQLDGSYYRPVSASTVLAGRVRLGSILGSDSSSLAPSRRLYSGGGGSVRGYGYQRLGPRDANGDPIGGAGLAEFSLEARVRLKAFGGNFGVVPFFDGGSLTTDSTPDFSSWQFGAGLGLRYYSSFGPIRLDVGMPLNRREGDPFVAVAVSLGQAF